MAAMFFNVDPNWNVLGMRATRSDSLILDKCWLPESAAAFCSDDMGSIRQFKRRKMPALRNYDEPSAIDATRHFLGKLGGVS
jgi:oligoribonuclease (3'-5' exoribonuclease)